MIVLATLALEPGRLTNDAAMFDKHNYPVKATTQLIFGKPITLIFRNIARQGLGHSDFRTYA